MGGLCPRGHGFWPSSEPLGAALHCDATASFMIHSLSPEVAATFSLLLFIIQIEPFPFRLQSLLNGLSFAGLCEGSLGYICR